MQVLVLGGTGQVGEGLQSLTPRCAIDVFAPDRAALELLDGLGLARMVWARPWDVVINAAAFTEVDRAEGEEAAAFALNAETPASLAAETARRGVPLIHISTDYVFDGHKGTPYVEENGAPPVNAYGRSKLAGEQAVGAMNTRHVILRTAWLHSPYHKNFVKTLLRLPPSVSASPSRPISAAARRPRGMSRRHVSTLRADARWSALRHLSLCRLRRGELVRVRPRHRRYGGRPARPHTECRTNPNKRVTDSRRSPAGYPARLHSRCSCIRDRAPSLARISRRSIDRLLT